MMTTALVLMALLAVPLAPGEAVAQGASPGFGGDGGSDDAGNAGGMGGAPGQDGTTPLMGNGGGGGGGSNGGAGAPGGGSGGGAGGLGGVNGAAMRDGGGGTDGVNGSGGGGGGGGYGLLIDGGGTFVNSDSIEGGNGGAGGYGSGVGGGGGGGGGGDGLIVTNGGDIINQELARGGRGGDGIGSDGAAAGIGGRGGAGGIGVSFAGQGTLTNVGEAGIFGGDGGDGGGVGVGGSGGSGGAGGAGVSFANGGILNNAGVIIGGGGGSGGAGNGNGFGAPSGIGGIGALGGSGVSFANGGVLNNNAGNITGGNGGGGGFGDNGVGGVGGGGGIGVSFANGGVLNNNAGNITGGNGGVGGEVNGGVGGVGGTGGIGVSFANSGTLINSGRIAGGTGSGGGSNVIGDQPGGIGGAGGNGGVGVSFANGGTLDNSGVIVGGDSGTGGTGPVSLGAPGVGGVGVAGASLTINNTGAISGGRASTGAQAYAIQLIGGTNYIGGSGQINGGIDIQGNSSFQPALPGSPVGTPLAINGPLRFASTSTYQIRVTPRAADSTAVTGVATLNGAAVSPNIRPGIYAPGNRFTIATATGGVVGTFSTATSNLAFIRPILSYDANNVYLSIRQLPFATAALTDNQRAVAGGLDGAFSMAGNRTGQGGKIFGALNQLTAAQARAAFDSLSGEGIAAAQNVANRSTQLFTSAIFDQTVFYAGGGAANSVTLTEPLPGFVALAARQPVRELADLPAARVAPVAPLPPPTRTWRAWATGFGGVENISGNARIGSAAQRNDIYGGALGVDYQLLPNYLLGVAVGGSNGNFRVDQRGTTGSTTGGHIAIYDLYELGNWYGASSSSFSYFGNQTTRFVNGFGGLGAEQNRGNFNSNEFRSRIEIGRHFASLPAFANLPAIAGFGTITPFVAIELASLRSNGFTETPLKGGPGLFRLNVSGQSASSAPGFVGLRFQRVTPFGGMVLSPTLQVAYVHEFAPYRNQIGTLASLPGSTFLVDGARPARDAAQVKAGAELAIGPHSAVFANFDGEFSGVNQLYAGKGGFRYVW